MRDTITAMRIRLPRGLDEQRQLGPDWGRWLDRLPLLFVEMLDEWALTRDGDDLWHGFCSLVAPVISADGTRAVLKITFDGDRESLHEGLVLQRWHGDGAVRLLRADPHRRAVLLERLDRRDLTELSDLEACQIVAGLYPKLHQPALPQLATLTSHVSRWLDDLAAQPRDIPIPPRYRDQARVVGPRPGQRPDERGSHHPRRPALRERPGDPAGSAARSRAVAGHRPEADVRRSPLRARAHAVEPVRRAGPRRSQRHPSVASTRWSSSPGSTRIAPGPGSSSG